MAVAMRASPKTALTKTSVLLYLDSLEAGARTPQTIKNYRDFLTRFLTVLGDRPVSVPVIHQYLNTYRSVNTRSSALVVLRQ